MDRLPASSLFLENSGKKSKQAWERDCDSDRAAASSIAARTSRSQSRSHAYTILRSSRSHGFSTKRETTRSAVYTMDCL